MSASTALKEMAPEMTYRTTKEGRKLAYQLTVIQQPERARACGSGAKCEINRGWIHRRWKSTDFQ